MSTDSQPANATSSAGDNTGLIIGGVVAGVVGLIAAALPVLKNFIPANLLPANLLA